MNNATEKNHYVPCFWSALWNEKYYNLKVSKQNAGKVRKQSLYILSLKSNEINESKTEDIFFAKKLGHIPINQSDYLELTAMDKTLVPESEPLWEEGEFIMDIENHFQMAEDAIGYEYIFKIIEDKKILENYNDKIKVSAFLFYHPLRSERYLLSLFEKYSEFPNGKFLALYEWKYLKDQYTDTLKVTEILESKWTVYSLDTFHFPLCDNPIINDGRLIIAVISPTVLIRINLEQKESTISYKSKIGCLEYRRVIKQIINNTDSLIANGDKSILEQIKKSKTWQRKRLDKTTF